MIFSHVLYQLSYPATPNERPTAESPPACCRLRADRPMRGRILAEGPGHYKVVSLHRWGYTFEYMNVCSYVQIRREHGRRIHH